MKRKIISFILSLCMCTGLLSGMSLGAFAADNDLSATSPDGEITLSLALGSSGEITYTLFCGGYQMIETSKMGLCTSLGDFKDGFSLKSSEKDSHTGSFSPVVGEQETINDNYNSLTATFTHAPTGMDFTIEVRAYNEGAAFRYKLFDRDEAYSVTKEYTSFKFPANTVAAVHPHSNQTNPQKVKTENLTGQKYRRPMEISYPNGYALTLCEANSFNYCSLELTGKTGTRELTSVYPDGLKNRSGLDSPNYVTVENGDPKYTPWRVFVTGKSESELPKNAAIVECLNPAPDEDTYDFSSWVNPGSCLRAAVEMKTDAIKDIIDQAQEHGIKYVLLDTGWYGPEYDVNCDPRLDPSKLDTSVATDKILMDNYFQTTGGYNNTGEGVFNTRGVGFDVYKELGTPGSSQVNVDIPALCDYANAKNVGIILYVNGAFFPDASGRDRFDADELFSYFEKWGVKGVKPGFVACRSQQFEKTVEDVIRAAAKHKLVMTIHDEYVPAGLERTFPNLLTAEGIHGDEGIGKSTPDVEYDIATLLTRPIQAPTDHTFCYPGKATKAYAVASPLMFRTGLNVLYWYTNPNSLPAADKNRLKILDNLPATWKKTLYLEAKSYEYATYARQSFDGNWYIGSLSASDRDLEISLSFLDDNTTYTATIYRDGADADPYAGWNSAAKANQTLLADSYSVNSQTVLQNKMKYGSGYAVFLTPADNGYEFYSYPKIALSDEIEVCDKISAASYTAESYADFKTALDNAKAVLDDASSGDDEYESALNSLVLAKEALAYSFTNLNALILKAERYSEFLYTAESYSALNAALENAKAAVSSSEGYSADQILGFETALKNAINSLVKSSAAPESKTYVTSANEIKKKFLSTANCFTYDKNRAGGDIRLLVDGSVKTFEKGIGIDAPSYMILSVPEGYDMFEAYVGIDYTKASANVGSVAFSVYDASNINSSDYESVITADTNNLSDEYLLASTGTIYGKSDVNAQKIAVPLKGVSKLLIYNDMVENQSSDWADWADAAFTKYADPAKAVSDIKINSVSLEGFDPSVYDYSIDASLYESVPVITASLSDPNASVSIKAPDALPGVGIVKLKTSTGKDVLYRLHFKAYTVSKYLSDLTPASVSTYGKRVTKDTDSRGNSPIKVWDENKNEVSYTRGIGAEASDSDESAIIYDISSYNFDKFETYASISYYALAAELVKMETDKSFTSPRSSIQYKFYLDDNLVYQTGVMKCETPAEHVSFDIGGAKTLKIVLDAAGSQAADWGVLADAKFYSSNNGEGDFSNLAYTEDLENFTATITGFVTKPDKNARAKITIPASINGLSVTAIADNAFRESGNVYSAGEHRISAVTLPGTIKSIGANAFCDCWSLKEINFPEGLETIGVNAFCHVGSIKFAAPSTLRVIDDKAFIYSSVTVLSLNDGLEKIGKQAFHWVSGTGSELKMPNSVTYIGTGAFRVCQNITTFAFPKNSTYTAIDKDVFAVDNTSSQAINITKLYIPDTITTVPSALFKYFNSENTCYVYAKKDSAAWKAAESAKADGNSGINNSANLVLVEYDYDTESRYSSVSAAVTGGKISATVNGNAAFETDLLTESCKVGTQITLTAKPENEDSSFLYWKDLSSDRIVSYEPEYSFTLGTDVSLYALFSAKDECYVTFTNANGKVLAAAISTNGITVPQNPYFAGYVFDGWYLNSVKTDLAANSTVYLSPKENVYYRAGFVKSNDKYEITITGAKQSSASYGYNEKVTLDALDKSSENLVFAYWLKDGKIVSYHESYSFYVSAAASIEAVYLKDKTQSENVITIFAKQIDSTRAGFYTEYDIDEKYTVIESGILMGPSDDLTFDSAPVKAAAQSKQNKAQFTARKKGLSLGDTYYAKGYVIYTDGENTYTIYSSAAACTIN